MTIVACPPYYLGMPPAFTPSFASTIAIDAAGEKGAFIITCPKAGTLNGIGFLLGAVTTFEDLKVSFQDIDATTGAPDGTPDEFRVVTGGAANTWMNTGLMTSDGTDTGTKRTVTAGQRIAVVIEFNSAVGNLIIQTFVTSDGSAFTDAVYSALFTASWAKQTGRDPIMALLYDDGTYPYLEGARPLASIVNSITANTGSTPDEIGNRFQLAAPLRIAGVWWYADRDGDCDFVLYDSNSNVLRTASTDKDIRPGTANAMGAARFSTVYDAANSELVRIVAKPTTVTNVGLRSATVNLTAMLEAMPGGSSMYRTARTDAGAWTDTNTEVLWMGLIVTGIDNGAGTGGSGGGAPVIHRGRGREVR